jgi:hypothetical protein
LTVHKVANVVFAEICAGVVRKPVPGKRILPPLYIRLLTSCWDFGRLLTVLSTAPAGRGSLGTMKDCWAISAGPVDIAR